MKLLILLNLGINQRCLAFYTSNIVVRVSLQVRVGESGQPFFIFSPLFLGGQRNALHLWVKHAYLRIYHDAYRYAYRYAYQRADLRVYRASNDSSYSSLL